MDTQALASPPVEGKLHVLHFNAETGVGGWPDLEVLVADTTPIKFRSNAFEQLVLPAEMKEIIRPRSQLSRCGSHHLDGAFLPVCRTLLGSTGKPSGDPHICLSPSPSHV